MRTRAAEARVVLPDPRTAFDAYADGDRRGARAGDVAMCSGERALEALRARRDAIAARGAVAAIASEPALTIAGSKQLTLDRAAALGIECPRSLQVSTPERGAGRRGRARLSARRQAAGLLARAARRRRRDGGADARLRPRRPREGGAPPRAARRAGAAAAGRDRRARDAQVRAAGRPHDRPARDGRRALLAAARRLVGDARDGRAARRLLRPRPRARHRRRPRGRLRGGVPPRRRRAARC